MRLAQLFSLFPQLGWGDEPTQDVLGLTSDSRKVQPGFVFVAVRGHAQDGHKYIETAVRAGAVGLVVEETSSIPSDFRGAVVQVKDSREALDRLAARYYGDPANSLFCVGVTGTNGKTSVTYMVEHLLTHFGWPTGVLGTIDHHLGEHIWASELTTPDPVTLQKRILEFTALDAKAVAFEVSSHALDQRRADQIPFDVGVFTNLTRDHLDYHGDMEEYFKAKQRLFSELLQKSSKRQTFAIINGDDPFGARMQVGDGVKRWRYSEQEGEFVFKIKSQGFDGSEFQLKTPRGEALLKVPLPGRHNVYNATAAVAVAMSAGMSLASAAQALLSFRGVPGRLERVICETIGETTGKNVFVDYAHTDDALRSVLNSLNNVRLQSSEKKRIITVFGCGGDRDKGKRPLMAKAACEHSDFVIVTSDNPRTEEPEKIIEDVLAGVSAEDLKSGKVTAIVDRQAAIERGLQIAQEGDVILIAGKGHEKYQIVGTEKRPFDDVEVVKRILK